MFPPLGVRALLAELTRANLLVEHVTSRYTFHDLLRTYAAEQAHTQESDQQRHAATLRMLDHYLHTAYTANRLMYPVADPITLTPAQPGVTPERIAGAEPALAWFTSEHAVLLAAIDHAAAMGFDVHSWQLAWSVHSHLSRRGHWHDYVASHRTAKAAAQRLADPTAQARTLRNLGHAHIQLGQFDIATTYLRHALNLATRAGDQAWQAHAHLGDHHRALAARQQSLVLHQELGDRIGLAATWDSLGYANHHLGHHAKAVACYQHALDHYRGHGDRFAEASTLVRLGEIHNATSNHGA